MIGKASSVAIFIVAHSGTSYGLIAAWFWFPKRKPNAERDMKFYLENSDGYFYHPNGLVDDLDHAQGYDHRYDAGAVAAVLDGEWEIYEGSDD